MKTILVKESQIQYISENIGTMDNFGLYVSKNRGSFVDFYLFDVDLKPIGQIVIDQISNDLYSYKK
jgi:hypothetical protein